jgi:hypothetical protein
VELKDGMRSPAAFNKTFFMKIILSILLMINGAMHAQTAGYVLQNRDGSLMIDDNSLSINKISGLQQAMNAKASLTGAEAITNKTMGAFNVGIDAGANDSYTITLSPAPAAYTTGMIVIFRANTQNTTGCSINVNSLGAKNIVKRVNTTPATADILALMWCMLIYDGTNFIILNPVVN